MRGPEPPAFCFVPKHRRIVVDSRANAGTTYAVRCFEWRWGAWACFQSGSRSVPRRKTARGFLFSNQRKARSDPSASHRPEPSASHVGVKTPYRRDGPAASVPQAIGYLSPCRQTKTRQASSKLTVLTIEPTDRPQPRRPPARAIALDMPIAVSSSIVASKGFITRSTANEGSPSRPAAHLNC